MEPEFRFCTSDDGTRIAYAAYGSGPPLLWVPTGAVSMDAYFTLPESRAYIDALASRTTVVTFDRRGSGASARDVEDLSPEAEVSDIAAVADAAGVRRFTLFAEIWSTAACAHYAIERPEQMERLVAWAPLNAPAADLKDLARLARTDWSSLRRLLAGRNFPEGPASLQRAWGAAMKNTVSPETCARQMETYAGIDLDALLPAVTTPVLVLTRAQPWARQNTMHVTGLLPNSQLRFVPGDAVTPFPEHGPVVEAVFEFMGLSGPTTANAAMPRGTAVIVFTDVADSTALTERMGDAAFRAASRTLDAAVRAAIRDCGGSPVEGKVLGDGVMGVFTSAAQAIDAARRCVVLSGESELRLHIGLHAGDVIREEDNVYGGAVNIASRICGLCEPGEILVSGTIRDLARTSAGATFEDRGEHLLKGIDDPVRVFAVRAE